CFFFHLFEQIPPSYSLRERYPSIECVCILFAEHLTKQSRKKEKKTCRTRTRATNFFGKDTAGLGTAVCSVTTARLFTRTVKIILSATASRTTAASFVASNAGIRIENCETWRTPFQHRRCQRLGTILPTAW